MQSFQKQIDMGELTPELKSEILSVQNEFQKIHNQGSQKIDSLIIQ
jgi:hypothetical protein